MTVEQSEAMRVAAVEATGLLADTRMDELDRIVRLVAQALDVPVALVSLVHTDRQVFAAQVGLGEPWATRGETPLSHSFCQYAVADAAPLLVEDARTHPLLHDNGAIEDLGVVAYAGLPVYGKGDAAVGALCAIDSEPRSWTRRDIEVLTELAETVSAHLKLRTAVADLESEQRLSRAQRHVLELLVGGEPLHEVLRVLVLGIEEALGDVRASVLIVDPVRRVLRNGASPSLPAAYVAAIDNLPISPSEGSCGTAAHTGRQVIAADVASDPLWARYAQLALPHGLLACWSTPIINASGTVLGTFATYLPTARHPTHAELARTDEARALALTVIDRAQADAALRERDATNRRLAARETGRGEIATLIARQQPLEDILASVLDHALSDTGAPAGLVGRHDGGTLHVEVARGELADPPDLGAMVAVPVRAGMVDWGVLALVRSSDATVPADTAHILALAELTGVALLAVHGRDQLEREANSDALTGLGNRRLFDRRLEAALAEGPGRVSLVLFDLDAFKTVNDAYGHAAGDDVLRAFASVLSANRRPRDLAARIGGDEFALLLVDTPGAAAQAVAHRVRAALGSVAALWGMSVSFGVATAEPADDAASLVRRADTLVYADKQR